MSNEDLAFTGEEMEGADPNFDLLFGGDEQIGDKPAPRMVGKRVVKKFDYYVVNMEGSKAQFSNDFAPGLSFMGRVTEGPTGSEGAVLFGNQWLTVKPTKVKNTKEGKFEVERTPAELTDAAEKIRGVLGRVVQTFGAEQRGPTSLTEDALNMYASQFVGPCVIAVSYRPARKGPQGQDWPESNQMMIASIAHPDEEVLKKDGTPTGETAIQEARRKIQEYNLKEVNSANSGRTAGSYGASSTPQEFT